VASPEDDDASRRQQAADRYRPQRVRLLLVAHAPPNNLERYFYYEDVREKDDLFRYVVAGLFGVKPERPDKRHWLGRLRESGVFLVDLVEHPYDGSELTQYVPGLVERAKRFGPDHVVLIKTDVFDAAFNALAHADLPVVRTRLPFPTSGASANLRRGLPQHWPTSAGILQGRSRSVA
jgi:hypothetical protein